MFIGQLSSDGFGCRLRRVLIDEGIDSRPAQPVARQTRIAVVDQSESVDGFQFYGDAPADTFLTPEEAIAEVGEGCAGIYVSSLMAAQPAAARAQRAAVVRAIEQTIPVFSDPNPRRSLWPDEQLMTIEVRRILSASRLAKLSLDDARTLGWSPDPETLIQKALEEWNTQLLVTDGANGSWALIAGSLAHIPAPPVDSVDATGSGDAFFAAAIFGVTANGGITIDGLNVASAAGALASTRFGAEASMPTKQEIDQFIAERR